MSCNVCPRKRCEEICIENCWAFKYRCILQVARRGLAERKGTSRLVYLHVIGQNVAVIDVPRTLLPGYKVAKPRPHHFIISFSMAGCLWFKSIFIRIIRIQETGKYLKEHCWRLDAVDSYYLDRYPSWSDSWSKKMESMCLPMLFVVSWAPFTFV